MRKFERRAAGAYPFFGLARWDERIGAWRPIKGSWPTQAEARKQAVARGRYRISRVDGPDGGGRDMGEFEVP